MQKCNGVKVFSATMVAERNVLGEKVSEWLARHESYEIVDIVVTQSSDEAFHCIAITVFFFDPVAAARTIPPTKPEPRSSATGSGRRLAFKEQG